MHNINIKKVSVQNQRKIDEVLKPQGTSKPPSGGSGSEADKYTIGRELALLVCRTLSSFSLVSHEAFKDFVMKLGGVRDRNLIPCSNTIARQCLDDIYNTCNAKLKTMIKDKMGQRGSVTVDMWTDGFNKTSYLTVTLHFVTIDMKLINVTLKTYRVDGSHTGSNLCNEIEKILIEFNIKDKNLIFVTDGGSNIVKAINLLGYQRQPCLAHALHRLVMFDLMEDVEMILFKEIVGKLKKIYRVLSAKKPELEKAFEVKENCKMWEKFLETCGEIRKKYFNILTKANCSNKTFNFLSIGDDDDATEQYYTSEWESDVNSQNSYTRLKKMCETRWSSMLTMIQSYMKNEGKAFC